MRASRTLTLLCVLCAVACAPEDDGDASGLDAGADTGTGLDAAADPRDAAEPMDAGALDAGGDAGAPVLDAAAGPEDAAEPMDAPSPLDSGEPTDAAIAADAPPDAPLDAGVALDAGRIGVGLAAHPTVPSFGLGDSTALAAADLDGDGDVDLVVANRGGAAETVWVNDGTGAMSAHPTTPSFGAGDSNGVALGDLDGDGDADAIVANGSGQAATVWLNDGSGAMSAHPAVPSFGAGDSSAVALGDLDGDGDLDAVIANAQAQAETVWRNDGSGAFSAHPTTPSFGAGASTAIALGDLDGDGDLDAVVANAQDQAETVWRNDGGGAFSAHPTTPSFGAGVSSAVVLADLDGDGDLDVIVAGANTEPERVWLNDGAGALGPHPTTPSFGADDSAGLAAGDLSTDGRPDVVIVNRGGSPATIWLNAGGGSLAAHPSTPSLGVGDSRAIVLVDLDGDSCPDAVVANAASQPETVWLCTTAPP